MNFPDPFEKRCRREAFAGWVIYDITWRMLKGYIIRIRQANTTQKIQ